MWLNRRMLTGQLIQGAAGADALQVSVTSDSFRSRLRRSFHRLGKLEECRDLLKSRWRSRALMAARGPNAVIPAAAALLIMTGRLSFGSFIAFSIVAGRALTAAGEAFGGLQMLARSTNAVRRREAREEGQPGGPSFHLASTGGSRNGLMVRGLTFTYPSGFHRSGFKVLCGASFSLAAGERIRLDGDSGAGKSTLLLILLGLLQPDTGDLFWNGENLVDSPPSRRGQLVSGLLQSPGFFDGSIRDNLTLFSPSPSEMKLQQALDFAGAADFVGRIPGGLDAPLRPLGTMFSGGELQRLAIARTLLSPAPLLLLDEPFSALDSEAVIRASEGFRILAGDSSLILVHHGAAVPMEVDRVLTLRNGRLG